MSAVGIRRIAENDDVRTVACVGARGAGACDVEAGVAGSAGISRPWGPLALGGDIRRRRGTFLCGRGHSTSSGAGILSPGAQGVPLRSGVHPAAWNVLGRSGSVGSGGVSTVDGVVELLRRSLSVQDDAGSAAEAVLDVLDLGVCDIGEAGALGGGVRGSGGWCARQGQAMETPLMGEGCLPGIGRGRGLHPDAVAGEPASAQPPRSVRGPPHPAR